MFDSKKVILWFKFVVLYNTVSVLVSFASEMHRKGVSESFLMQGSQECYTRVPCQTTSPKRASAVIVSARTRRKAMRVRFNPHGKILVRLHGYCDALGAWLESGAGYCNHEGQNTRAVVNVRAARRLTVRKTPAQKSIFCFL